MGFQQAVVGGGELLSEGPSVEAAPAWCFQLGTGGDKEERNQLEPCLLCAGSSRHSTHTISCKPHNKQPKEVGIVVFLSDEEIGPEKVDDLLRSHS